MTKVTFETATLADAIKKAEKVAPSKGKAFDKAAGIVFEITPGAQPPVVIRATNLDIYSMEWVDALSVEGEPAKWRLPSSLINQVVGSLSIASGSTTTLEEVVDKKGHSFVQLTTSGRTKAKFNMMSIDEFPIWSAFDPDNLMPVEGIGGRIAQVEWAAAKDAATPILCGVHFDGELCVSTDRYRLAVAELPIKDLEYPVTVPAGLLGGILKERGEVLIGVEGGQFLMMPDKFTQIRAIMYGMDYPKVSRIMDRDKPQTIKVRKAGLLEIMARATAFSGNERFPTLRVFFGNEEIAVMMDNYEVGLLGDVVEVPGQAMHPRYEIKFAPRNIMEGITRAPNEEVDIGYDTSKPKGTIYINGGSGYEAWIMPRGDTPTKDE